MPRHKGVVITAGFNRSKSAIALAERINDCSVRVNGIVVVSPYSLRRLRKSVQSRGISFIKHSIPRLLGKQHTMTDDGRDYLQDYLESNLISYKSLRQWAGKNDAEFLSVSNLNSPAVVKYIKDKTPTWLIYSGGGILKADVIEAVEGRVLNAHQGPLPQIRGMNACEWSILLDQKQEVTIHLINEKIDTGQIIITKPFFIKKNDTIKSLRSKAVLKGIEGLAEVAAKPSLDNFDLKLNNSNHRQCYILAPQLKHLLDYKLQHIKTHA